MRIENLEQPCKEHSALEYISMHSKTKQHRKQKRTLHRSDYGVSEGPIEESVRSLRKQFATTSGPAQCALTRQNVADPVRLSLALQENVHLRHYHHGRSGLLRAIIRPRWRRDL